MQVIISVGGKFHAFYLAQQLFKKGCLKKLITSYPKLEVKKSGIPLKKVNSIIIKEILLRGWSKLPSFLRNIYNPHFLISELFDRLASKKIRESDIFVGWSTLSLHSLRKAKELGAITILERGSSHMLYQEQALREEYKKLGLKHKDTHPKIIEKELKEYEETDYISIPSLYAKRTFLEKGIPESKLIHIPYGVDLSEFGQIPKKDNVFRIVFVGRISLRKGVHYLLQAFSELKLPNSELSLIGTINDEMKPFLKKYEGSYKWLGHKPQKELYKYYSQGSVFVLSSIDEGFGMVIFQAMACGLPAICTVNTGGPDLIENDREGFIIPIRDVEALKEKILFFYDNPKECYKMGQNAKRKVQKGFTWNDYGKRMIREYKKILDKKQKDIS